MAGSLSNPSKGRRGFKPSSDINVTPLVDVMLVLLIIFMVTAPMLTVSVPVDLPKTDAAQLNQDDKEPLIVSIDVKGILYIQDSAVPEDQIVEKLKAITQNNQDAKIYVRGDKNLPYGQIMNLMGMISAGGFSKVSLIAEAQDSSKKVP